MRPQPTSQACRAAAQLGRTVNRALEASELTPAAYRLLAYLSTGSAAANVLADKLSVSRPTITATTDWLVARGFAHRQADAVDRRRVSISMTPRGAAALKRADGLVAERLVDVLDPLPPADAQGIVDALDVLLDALNAYRVREHQSSGTAPRP